MADIKINDKSTKAQIMEAYNQAMEELEKLRAMTDLPVEKAKEEELAASLENATVAASSNVFSDKIVEQYNDLKEAIKYYKKELEDLYGIKAKADGLAAAINAHKNKVAMMDDEYSQKKATLDKELAEKGAIAKEKIAEFEKLVEKAKRAADEEISEYKEALQKQRNRENDEYAYDLKKAHKLDADMWSDEKAKRKAEIQAEADAVKAREEAVASREKEIKDMEEKIAAFPAELEAAKEEAAKSAKDKAEKSFAFEKRYIETEKKHAEEMSAAKIENLTSQVEDLIKKNMELSEKLDAAYDKMKEMATATVQAGATVKVVSSNDK